MLTARNLNLISVQSWTYLKFDSRIHKVDLQSFTLLIIINFTCHCRLFQLLKRLIYVYQVGKENKENHQIRDDVIMFRQFFETDIYKKECIVFNNRSYLTVYFDRLSLPLFVKCVK